jgi:putative heme iron utilization protein
MEHRDQTLSTDDTDRIVEHMNEEHTEALCQYAAAYGGIENAESAEMVGIDAEGMDLRVSVGDTTREVRIPFERPVQTPDDAHRLLVDLAIRAREKEDDQH